MALGKYMMTFQGVDVMVGEIPRCLDVSGRFRG